MVFGVESLSCVRNRIRQMVIGGNQVTSKKSEVLTLQKQIDVDTGLIPMFDGRRMFGSFRLFERIHFFQTNLGKLWTVRSLRDAASCRKEVISRYFCRTSTRVQGVIVLVRVLLLPMYVS